LSNERARAIARPAQARFTPWEAAAAAHAMIAPIREPADSNLPDLNKILASGQLPALPQSAIRLLELAKDERNGPGEFAVPIEADPGLMSQVLRFVNSSYFGFAREISSVKHATTLVGIRTVKNFVLWSAVFSLMPNPKCGQFHLSNLWQDSLRRALFARLAARLLRLRDAEEPFVGALLQDMALPLLVKEYPQAYTRLLAERAKGPARLSDLEREEFGWTHAEVGGQIARRWNLPETATLYVERHTALDDLEAGPGAAAGELAVALSALLPSTCDAGWPECECFEAHYRRLLPATAPAPCETLARVDIEFTDFAPVLKVAAPPRSLVECYRAAHAAAVG
jgi:HD-like signal output (HDOD) protein